MPVITQAAEKIKRFLRSRHKEQADLAREAGLSTAAVTHWMKGRRVPARKHIKWLIEWSEGYLSDTDFDTPYRRNVAIPEPPPMRAERTDPFVEVPKDKPPKLFVEETLYLNGHLPIRFSNINSNLVTDGAINVMFGENTLGMSAPLTLLSLIDRNEPSC